MAEQQSTPTRGRPLTPEERRIMRAASEGRLLNPHGGRWTITGEERPDNKSRRSLQSRGLLDYAKRDDGRTDWRQLVPTEKGEAQR